MYNTKSGFANFFIPLAAEPDQRPSLEGRPHRPEEAGEGLLFALLTLLAFVRMLSSIVLLQPDHSTKALTAQFTNERPNVFVHDASMAG